MSYESELVTLTWGLYCFDRVLFLKPCDAVLHEKRAGVWTVDRGLTSFTLAGRAPFLGGLWRPDAPVFRLSTGAQGHGVSHGHRDLRAVVGVLHLLRPYSLMAAIALYGLLPLGLFSSLGRPCLILSVLLMYGSILCALTLIYRKRASIGLSRGEVLTFAFESLACPPFGVALVPRLTLSVPSSEKWLDLLEGVVPTEAVPDLTAECLAVIDAALSDQDGDSDHAECLRRTREQLLLGRCES